MKNNGFTLIEMLIYIGLFSIIMGGAIVSAFNIFESTGRNQTKAMMAEEGMYLIGKINWALAGAKTVDTHSPERLSVNKSGIPPTENPIVFDIFSGAMRLKRGENDPRILSNKNVSVEDVAFVHSSSLSNGIAIESVDASFTITARTPEGLVVSENFHTIKYIKK